MWQTLRLAGVAVVGVENMVCAEQGRSIQDELKLLPREVTVCGGPVRSGAQEPRRDHRPQERLLVLQGPLHRTRHSIQVPSRELRTLWNVAAYSKK